MISVTHTPLRCQLRDDLATAGNAGVSLWWLGQAGFILSCNGMRILIDPYLSDSLALKYRGQDFPHRRMMPPPVSPRDLHDVNWVFCTHAHSDHMDPGTLPSLAKNNRGCRFVVPCAEASTARARGIPEDRMVLIDAGETVDLGCQMGAEALPAAHEDLARDQDGHFRYLGYCLRLGDCKFYHSGDSIPYDGLGQHLSRMKADVALLPVNGRDDRRRRGKVPGNFTIPEAVDLCKQAAVPVLIAHHWGMFDFNTVSEAALKVGAASALPEVNFIIPNPSTRCDFWQEAHATLAGSEKENKK